MGSDRCHSIIGSMLGHKWKPMRQIVPAAVPDTRTMLGQGGWKLETHHFCFRCRTFKDHRHQAAMAGIHDADALPHRSQR